MVPGLASVCSCHGVAMDGCADIFLLGMHLTLQYELFCELPLRAWSTACCVWHFAHLDKAWTGCDSWARSSY